MANQTLPMWKYFSLNLFIIFLDIEFSWNILAHLEANSRKSFWLKSSKVLSVINLFQYPLYPLLISSKKITYMIIRWNILILIIVVVDASCIYKRQNGRPVQYMTNLTFFMKNSVWMTSPFEYLHNLTIGNTNSTC
jgi:hypothetical protein